MHSRRTLGTSLKSGGMKFPELTIPLLIYRRRTHRERQSHSHRFSFHLHIDRCACWHIERLGHDPVDAIFWLDSRFLQAIQTMWNHHGFSGEKSNLSFPGEAE